MKSEGKSSAEDREYHREKCKSVIYDIAKDVFNRLDQNISNLRLLSYQLAAIIISSISILGAFLALLIQNSNISSIQIPLKSVIFFFILIAFGLGILSFLYLCWKVMHFKAYYDIKVFDKDYEKLKKFCEENGKEERLYDHFQHFMEKAYKYNEKKYKKEMKEFEKALKLFFAAFIILVGIVIVIILFSAL